MCFVHHSFSSTVSSVCPPGFFTSFSRGAFLLNARFLFGVKPRQFLGGILLYAVLLLSSCEKAPIPAPVSEGELIKITQPNSELDQIILRARETLPEFIEKLNAPGADEGNFQVKYPFAADPESGFAYEHIWLRDIRLKDGRYYGTVTNQPCYCSGLTLGAVVSFSINNISDWMYTQGEKIIGGHSIKLLMEELPDLDAGTAAFYKKF
ncbi:DUF2314 domain-containing protein [Treponema sp. TIM-1]|uniref:DUF2314 domain-containing protein n=1 Tax=Treponema sp. TIM-1 TaxID=2898417 RepID=UPI0039803FCF